MCFEDEWDKPYTRTQAAFPAPWVKANKFWPTVGRVDNVHGDRNLVSAVITNVCTQPSLMLSVGVLGSGGRGDTGTVNYLSFAFPTCQFATPTGSSDLLRCASPPFSYSQAMLTPPSRPPSFRGRALLPPTLVVAPDLLVPAHGHLHRRADRRMSRLTSRVVLF